MTLEGIRARCKVDADTGCWLWQGNVDAGVPCIRIASTKRSTRVVVAELSGRRQHPSNRWTCRCGEPQCVAPGHLLSKRSGPRKGFRKNADVVLHMTAAVRARAKLTLEEARALRQACAEGLSYAKAGKRFGISKSRAREIALGLAWREATPFSGLR